MKIKLGGEASRTKNESLFIPTKLQGPMAFVFLMYETDEGDRDGLTSGGFDDCTFSCA